MIRLGEDKDKEILKKLWKLCFPDDTNEFICLYFDQVYKNDETLVYTENDKPVASLQMIPYSFKTGTTISLAGYISGAMTHPAFRKKGYMSRLLNASFEVLKEKKYDYTFLIPQKEYLFEFYEKQGYVKAFPERIAKLSSDFPDFSSSASSQKREVQIYESLQDLFSVPTPYGESLEKRYWQTYSCFLFEKTNVILKTESQFTHILWDFFTEKGVLFANEEGWAFSFREKDQIILKEFFYQDKTVKQFFLQAIREYYALKKLTICNDPDAPFVRYKGMIKALNETKELITDIYAGMMLD